MAAATLSREEGDPIHSVADIASKKIDEAIALLHEYLESGDEPVPATPSVKPVSPAARRKRKGK
jgi:hypothetical protein